MPHDISKLPKWAQDKICRQAETIRQQADELHHYRRSYETLPDDTNDTGFRLEVRRVGRPLLHLPMGHYRCRIQTPHGYGIDLDPRSDGLGVRVVADPGRGTDCLLVLPQAANHAVLSGRTA